MLCQRRTKRVQGAVKDTEEHGTLFPFHRDSSIFFNGMRRKTAVFLHFRTFNACAIACFYGDYGR